MEIIWTRPALSDFIALQDYIAAENPSAAFDIACRIKQATQQLTTFPELGRVGRVAETRELIIADTPYIVPYQINENVIYLLAVFHSSRKWPDHF